MRTIVKILILGLIIFNLGCATFRANLYIIENTLPEEKALILYTEAAKMYEEDIKIYKDYSKIKKAVQLYKDAYEIDNSLKDSNSRITEINTYAKEVFNANIKRALELTKVKSRSKEEDFEFVLLVSQASVINLKHKELAALKKESRNLEFIVKERQAINIRALEPRISTTTEHRDLLFLVGSINIYIDNLEKLEPFNKIAGDSRVKVSNHVLKLINEDLKISTELIDKKDFVAGEQSLNRAIEKFTIIDIDGTEKINDAKYYLYLNWGKELLKRGKYQSARISGELARSIKRTEESQKLLNDITAITSQRNFESTIDDVLESIDFYIEKNDFVMAKRIIDINIPKFTKAENKKKLSNKELTINDRIYDTYSKALELYNQEDYKAALEKFEIVIEYNKNYKDVKAYFDKTEIKVKALYGG